MIRNILWEHSSYFFILSSNIPQTFCSVCIFHFLIRTCQDVNWGHRGVLTELNTRSSRECLQPTLTIQRTCRTKRFMGSYRREETYLPRSAPVLSYPYLPETDLETTSTQSISTSIGRELTFHLLVRVQLERRLPITGNISMLWTPSTAVAV